MVLVRSGSTYDEYKGSIKRINDTVYNIKANLIFCQTKCRAIGDSLFYLTLDSAVRHTEPTIKFIYSNNEIVNCPALDKDNTCISINKKLFNANADKNNFSVTAGHKNPITKEEITTSYDVTDEYCMTMYAGNEVIFNVKIKNGLLKSEGKNQVDKLLLRN